MKGCTTGRGMDRSTGRSMGRQQGGTLAGLMIGLIIGLLVAVGVAMTVMKTPLPFVDKLGKQAQPAGELGDPNKTLPGGARERRDHMNDDEATTAEPAHVPAPSSAPAPAAGKKAIEPSPAASASAKEPVPGAAAPANKAGAAANPAANPAANSAPNSAPNSATNSATSANSNAASNSSATGSGGDAFTYYLQAGAFREQLDAEATKGRLALMGVAATIAERKSELGTLYRVRVGPFADVDAMNRARVRLSDNGVDAAVVRVPK